MKTFLEFVKDNGGDAEVARSLVNSFIQYPPNRDRMPKKCSYTYSYAFPKDPNYQMVREWVIGRAVDALSIYRVDRDNALGIKVFGINAFGDTDGTFAKIFMLYQHAAMFKFFNVGDCSFRCSLAALELRRTLPKEIFISMRSNAGKDQFYLMLGNSQLGYFVYDPLTNPTLLFHHTTYAQDVLAKFHDVDPRFKAKDYKLVQQSNGVFKKVPGKKMFNLKVTEEHVHQFEGQWPTINRYFLDCIQAQGFDPKTFLGNHADIKVLTKQRPIKWAQFHKVLRPVLNRLKNEMQEKRADGDVQLKHDDATADEPEAQGSDVKSLVPQFDAMKLEGDKEVEKQEIEKNKADERSEPPLRIWFPKI